MQWVWFWIVGADLPYDELVASIEADRLRRNARPYEDEFDFAGFRHTTAVDFRQTFRTTQPGEDLSEWAGQLAARGVDFTVLAGNKSGDFRLYKARGDTPLKHGEGDPHLVVVYRSDE